MEMTRVAGHPGQRRAVARQQEFTDVAFVRSHDQPLGWELPVGGFQLGSF
jgi:hypothetical protein